MQLDEILDKSIIIAGHPDDEILWFSSLIEKVDIIVICFLEHKSNPGWSAGRKKSLSQYPLKNMFYLGIDASETFNGADWQNPVIKNNGIEIANKSISTEKYNSNFFELTKALKHELTGYKNVITHNPWGEYGHEDHIQVYRAVKSLQAKMHFTLWFSNYCSNKSLILMSRYFSTFDSKIITLKTNKIISYDIAELYKKNGCWTWYDDYKWPNEESFIKDNIDEEDKKAYGNIFPLNMINVKNEQIVNKSTPKNIFSKLKEKLIK